jgi:hypothetical protein
MVKSLVLSLVMFTAGIAFAQTVKPQLGVDHLVRIKMVREVRDAALKSCETLPIMQSYRNSLKETNEKIESEYVGWTLDWNKMDLVPKPATSKD